MKLVVKDNSFRLWLTADETYNWANKPNGVWPCSTISEHDLYVEYDEHGLLDYYFDNQNRGYQFDDNEFSAIITDHVVEHLEPNHPCLVFF